MNDQLYRAVMREVSDLQLLTVMLRNLQELIRRSLLTPYEAEQLVDIISNSSQRAEASELALRKLKENLS